MPSRGCRPALPTSTPSAPRQKNRSARQKHVGSACCKSKHSAPASSSIRRLEASALRVEIIAPFDDLWPIHDKHPHQFYGENCFTFGVVKPIGPFGAYGISCLPDMMDDDFGAGDGHLCFKTDRKDTRLNHS